MLKNMTDKNVNACSNRAILKYRNMWVNHCVRGSLYDIKKVTT